MSVIEDRKEFNIKCLGINISAQTMDGIPFNIVVKNIDPDGQVKIGVEKGFDRFFPFGFSLELKGEYGEVEFHIPEELMEKQTTTVRSEFKPDETTGCHQK